MALASFGPYLIGGVRTEQLAFYGFGMLTAPIALRSRTTKLFAVTVTLWGAITLISLAGAVFPVHSEMGASGSLAAGLDNLLIPASGLLIGAAWSRRGDEARRSMLDVLSAAYCYGLILNTVLAVLSDTRTIPWLTRFWSSGAGESVAERAASLGRLTGIFNQPAEAGLAYALGLVLALWRWSWRQKHPAKLTIISTALIVGGLMSVSKIFVLVGLPVFAIALWSQRRRRLRRVILTAPPGALVLFVLASGWFAWSGQERLQRLLSGQREGRTQLEFLTAGRYGDDSSIGRVARTVMDESPFGGYGVRGFKNVASDSVLLEMLILGGISAAVLCGALLVIWTAKAIRRRRTLQPLERRMALSLLAVTIGAAFGLPSLTANRSSGVLWLALGLCLIHVPEGRWRQSRAMVVRPIRHAPVDPRAEYHRSQVRSASATTGTMLAR